MAITAPLRTNGRFIVDVRGHRVRLAGVNWFGAHQDHGVPAGLDRVHRAALAQTIARLGFNSVRFPFSLWMMDHTSTVPDRQLTANPDLRGSTPMQVYDACVAALTGAGLIVIPNCHMLFGGWCCAEDDNNGLWYNDSWSAAKFTAAWQNIARRYRSNRLVAAMDIKNEPRSATVGGTKLSPTWGIGGSGTDFAAMYTATGNLIHQISPDVLIICEGLGYAADLTGVAAHPVRLARPSKVVYSLHDYPWYHKGSPRSGSGSSAPTPGRWPTSGWRPPRGSAMPPMGCGGTTSRPGWPRPTPTGAGGGSTPPTSRAPRR